jgi:NAD(P)-dependent dehydrogenase (short-subunit alcohol dehydrogenase family)
MLVTGGGGGLGRAMAEGFAREGAAVAVTDVNLDAARTVVRGIEERGGRALAMRWTSPSEEQVERGRGRRGPGSWAASTSR